MISVSDLERMKALAEGASPGEWRAWKAPTGEWTVRAQWTEGETRVTAWPAVCNAGGQPNQANAAFIASSRTDNPRLIAEVERLRGVLERIRDLEPTPYEFPADWSAQIEACPECKRCRGHPIQHGICDTHRRPLWARDEHDASERRALGSTAKSLASQALQEKPS